MFMTFAGFAAVLIVWVLWAYNMGFGSAWFHSGNYANYKWTGATYPNYSITSWVNRPRR